MDTLSNEEIENCRVAFNKFDKDGSGSISDWELRAMLQCAHPQSYSFCPSPHTARLLHPRDVLDHAVVANHAIPSIR